MLKFNPAFKFEREKLREILDKATPPTDEEFVLIQTSTRPLLDLADEQERRIAELEATLRATLGHLYGGKQVAEMILDVLNDHLSPERKKRERENLWKER